MRVPASILAAAALGGLAPGAAAASTAATPNPFASTGARAPVVLFVPLDERAKRLLRTTVPVVARWLRSRPGTTAVASSSPLWKSAERRQLNAPFVTSDLLGRFRYAQGARSAFVIAVTSASMYDPAIPSYRFVFGFRRVARKAGNVQAVAVIGTREMRVFHRERERARLTKMILRYVGEVMCGLPRVADPKSVLYDPILSDADLDAMVARLPRRC